MPGQNFLVLGPTGKSGILTVKLALEHGHKVTAYARNTTKLRERLGETASNKELTILSGDLPSAPATLTPLLPSFDAVISILGPNTRDYSGTQVTAFYEWILPAIRDLPARQRPYLLAMGTQSIEDPNDAFSFFNKIHILFMMWLAPGAREEIMGIKRVFRDEVASNRSDVDWTVYRLNLLKDGGLSGGAKAGYVGKDGMSANLDRAQLASWLVEQAEKGPGERQWARKMPALWGEDAAEPEASVLTNLSQAFFGEKKDKA